MFAAGTSSLLVYRYTGRRLTRKVAGKHLPAMARGNRQPQGKMSLAPRLMHPATRMPAGESYCQGAARPLRLQR